MTTINNQLNAAANGAVLCLQRGSNWNVPSGLTLTQTYPDTARVIVCASDGSTCTDTSSNPNPRITTNGTCVHATTGSGGLTVKNLDCYDGGAGAAPAALDVSKGSANVSFEGGVIDGRFQPIYLDGGSTTDTPANNVHFGTCANRIEVRNGPAANPTGGDRNVSWGVATNLYFSLWVHDFIGYSGHPNEHMLDIARNTGATHYTPSVNGAVNLTIECSLFESHATSNPYLGEMLKIALASNAVIRNNIFRVTGFCISGNAMGGGSHNATNETEGWDGGAVYGNLFDMGVCKGPIAMSHARNVDIYNNVMIATNADEQRGFIEFDYAQKSLDPGQDDLSLQNLRVFNNTIYRSGNSSAVGSGWAIFNENMNPAPNWPAGTGFAIFNNLIYDTDAVDAKVINTGYTGCNGYGTNGANIRSNFIYTPNDNTPSVISCSGSTLASSGYQTAPGVANASAGQFGITTTSKVYGSGGSGCPTTDYVGASRPSPCSIGAYDVSASGSASPLLPPTLVQASPGN